MPILQPQQPALAGGLSRACLECSPLAFAELNRLRHENAVLRQQIAALMAPVPEPNAERRLAALEATITALLVDRKILQLDHKSLLLGQTSTQAELKHLSATAATVKQGQDVLATTMADIQLEQKNLSSAVATVHSGRIAADKIRQIQSDRTDKQQEDIAKCLGDIQALTPPVICQKSMATGLEQQGEDLGGRIKNVGVQVEEHVKEQLSELGARINGIEKDLELRIINQEKKLLKSMELGEDQMSDYVDQKASELSAFIKQQKNELDVRIDRSKVELSARINEQSRDGSTREHTAEIEALEDLINEDKKELEASMAALAKDLSHHIARKVKNIDDRIDSLWARFDIQYLNSWGGRTEILAELSTMLKNLASSANDVAAPTNPSDQEVMSRSSTPNQQVLVPAAPVRTPENGTAGSDNSPAPPTPRHGNLSGTFPPPGKSSLSPARSWAALTNTVNTPPKPKALALGETASKIPTPSKQPHLLKTSRTTKPLPTSRVAPRAKARAST